MEDDKPLDPLFKAMRAIALDSSGKPEAITALDWAKSTHAITLALLMTWSRHASQQELIELTSTLQQALAMPDLPRLQSSLIQQAIDIAERARA